MSYFMNQGLRGLRGLRGFGGPEECTTGEHWDEAAGVCLCNAGLTPAPTVGGGCVAVKPGGTTGDNCLMQGMDFDLVTHKCIPRCKAGEGRDMHGNCVKRTVCFDQEVFDAATQSCKCKAGYRRKVDGGCERVTSGGGAPIETATEMSKAAFPWLLGAGIVVGGLALVAAMTSKRKGAQPKAA